MKALLKTLATLAFIALAGLGGWWYADRTGRAALDATVEAWKSSGEPFVPADFPGAETSGRTPVLEALQALTIADEACPRLNDLEELEGPPYPWDGTIPTQEWEAWLDGLAEDPSGGPYEPDQFTWIPRVTDEFLADVERLQGTETLDFYGRETTRPKAGALLGLLGNADELPGREHPLVEWMRFADRMEEPLLETLDRLGPLAKLDARRWAEREDEGIEPRTTLCMITAIRTMGALAHRAMIALIDGDPESAAQDLTRLQALSATLEGAYSMTGTNGHLVGMDLQIQLLELLPADAPEELVRAIGESLKTYRIRESLRRGMLGERVSLHRFYLRRRGELGPNQADLAFAKRLQMEPSELIEDSMELRADHQRILERHSEALAFLADHDLDETLAPEIDPEREDFRVRYESFRAREGRRRLALCVVAWKLEGRTGLERELATRVDPLSGLPFQLEEGPGDWLRLTSSPGRGQRDDWILR